MQVRMQKDAKDNQTLSPDPRTSCQMQSNETVIRQTRNFSTLSLHRQYRFLRIYEIEGAWSSLRGTGGAWMDRLRWGVVAWAHAAQGPGNASPGVDIEPWNCNVPCNMKQECS